MDKSSGLKSLTRFLFGHPSRRDFSQLVVHEGEKLGRGLGIAGRRRIQEFGDIGHGKPILPHRLDVETLHG